MRTEPESSFFLNQNIWLKIFFVVISLINVFFIDSLFKGLFFSSVLIVILFVNFSIIKTWAKLILRMLPLFSSIILLGIIFSIDFVNQILLINRIINLLLISVFILNVFDFDKGMSKMSKNKIIYFFLTTLSYVNRLLIEFNHIDKTDTDFFETFKSIIKKVSKEKISVNSSFKSVESTSSSKKYFTNLYGIAMIFIQILAGITVELCNVI